MYNTTIFNSYKSEGERKNICKVDGLKYCDGNVIRFVVEYKEHTFVVTSSQHNNRQIGVCVTIMGESPINFYDTVDVRAQSINNLVYAMDAILKNMEA